MEGEDRGAADHRFRGISDVLLDIEGTTCPVSFVADVLFPYASDHLGDYLQRHGHTAAVEKLLGEVEQAWQQDSDREARALREREGRAVISYLRLLIRQDRKLPALKELQGMIWREGYGRGELRVHLYDDVPPTLRHWHREGIRLSVYSSGSVSAQKLLYGHTDAGDLRPLFTAWFDTRTGPKTDVESYRRIAAALGGRPEQVLFISDSLPELTAAQEAGLRTVWCRREEATIPPQSNQEIDVITTLNLSSLDVTTS
jgi:enolase-phosphatase E1